MTIMSPLLQHQRGQSNFQVRENLVCDLLDFSQSSSADSTQRAREQDPFLHTDQVREASSSFIRGTPCPPLHTSKHQSLGGSQEQMEIKCRARRARVVVEVEESAFVNST